MKYDSIFLVEDDPIMVFGLQKMLNTLVNCNDLIVFNNGKKAIIAIHELLEKGKPLPDMLFLDINMPIMDGWQFLSEFIEISIEPRIQIHILSSTIDSADFNTYKAFKQRSNHYITYNKKPLTRAQLKELLLLAQTANR